MEVLSVIMSGLALLAAMASLALWIWERKRSQKQRATMIRLISSETKAAVKYTDIEVKKVHAKADCIRKDLDSMISSMAETEKNVKDLMQGVVPDYEEAVKARDAVSSFSRDIAAILNFDPLQAAKETRMRNRSGQEVE